MPKLPINDQEEIVTFDDGFRYYWPVSNRGALSAHNLREIADYLDELNKPWQEQLDNYFKKVLTE